MCILSLYRLNNIERDILIIESHVLNKQTEDKLLLVAEMQHYDAQRALQKVNKRIARKSSKQWMITLQKIAAVMLIPVLLGSVSYILYLNRQIQPLETAWQTVETMPGQKSFVELTDGTRVWLNSDSKLTYPVSFNRKNREVKLSGEAFFDVTKNEKSPFFVNVGDIGVQVLGTEFSINNYSDEDNMQIYLKSGIVELLNNKIDDKRLILRLDPGERAVYSKTSNKLILQKAQSDICLAWMEGKLIFRDEPMIDVVRKLNRSFNVEIFIADPEIEEYTYTATFQHESLKQILELLKISAPIDYKIAKREKNEYNMFTKNRVELYTP